MKLGFGQTESLIKRELIDIIESGVEKLLQKQISVIDIKLLSFTSLIFLNKTGVFLRAAPCRAALVKKASS